MEASLPGDRPSRLVVSPSVHRALADLRGDRWVYDLFIFPLCPRPYDHHLTSMPMTATATTGTAATPIDPASAVLGFAAWLTGRRDAVTIGADNDCAIVADLVEKFRTSQGWDTPPEHFTAQLRPYPADDVGPTLDDLIAERGLSEAELASKAPAGDIFHDETPRDAEEDRPVTLSITVQGAGNEMTHDVLEHLMELYHRGERSVRIVAGPCRASLSMIVFPRTSEPT